MTNSEVQNASAFYYNGLASLAKSIVFRSISINAKTHQERINSTVSIYYSFLHLAISLMYFCPNKIDQNLCNKLLVKRDKGQTDPSVIIKHSYAIKFVCDCTKNGLDRNFSVQFETAKRLREFVNYGPRVTINVDTPNFGPCNSRPADSDDLISSIDKIFYSAMLWAKNNSPLNGDLVIIALSQCKDFFQKNDLFYTQWCSEYSLGEAIGFLEKIKNHEGLAQPGN